MCIVCYIHDHARQTAELGPPPSLGLAFRNVLMCSSPISFRHVILRCVVIFVQKSYARAYITVIILMDRALSNLFSYLWTFKI